MSRVTVYAERLGVTHPHRHEPTLRRLHAEEGLSPEEISARDEFDCSPVTVRKWLARHDLIDDDPDAVEMDTSDGRAIRYRRVATFSVSLDDQSVTLHGYRREDEESDSVFVPFRDKTTGQQTYEGGRYMELEPDRTLQDGDRVTIDFNLAYSPFCAYSETFSCPLPPEENWLDTAIEAGERTP